MNPYRVIFSLAAVYNVAFGIWAGCFPLAFFHVFELEEPRYPSIWACLGMVVGLYAVLYAAVALRPEQGDLLAAVGLIGKVLGPCGWILTVNTSSGLPARTFPLILCNDLVWWFPFLFYLLRNYPWQRSLIAALSVVVHLAACLGLLAVEGGTEMVPNLRERAAWVAGSPSAWTAVWFAWTLSSLSLLALCIAWSTHVFQHVQKGLAPDASPSLGAMKTMLVIGCLLVAIGLGFDLAGEIIQITVVSEAGSDLEQFEWGTSQYNWLGPGAANGLYCLGGLLLSYVAWRANWLRGAGGTLGVVMWMSGLVLTLAAFLNHADLMVFTGAAVMLLFLPFAGLLGWKMKES